jgi:hypothetical protein
MQVITDKELYRKIWDKVFIDYSFSPSIDGPRMWLRPKGTFQTYKLGQIWEEEQEAIVNTIFCKVIGEEMYALDWQHDCFLFDPNERIPPGFQYYDSQRACNVFFPEYYPNGDYHFFVSKDWSSGLYGHPWRKELIVAGEDLILAIEKNLAELGLKKQYS